MEWYQTFSYVITNGIRFFLCLCLISELLNFQKDTRKIGVFSVGAAVIIALLPLLALPQIVIIGAEMVLLIAASRLLFKEQARMSLFVIFFYEIAVALWEFIISSGLGVAFHSERFIDSTTAEYLMAVWIVRLFMLGVLVFVAKKKEFTTKGAFRFASIVAIFALFSVIALASQTAIHLSDDKLTTWTILSVILLLAVLFFNQNRQLEMEKEIARLKAEQAEILERDYKALNDIYSANSKLFHDFHNHIEIMRQYLLQDKTAEAISYLEDMRTPIQEITQTAWTGDNAIDYLISSKLSLAEGAHIPASVNIEFPRNTDIKSADLTAILGNLLDNALEASQLAKDEIRFLNLVIRRINNMLIIKVENGCEAPPVKVDGELQSTKQDDGLHGWGLKSVRAAVERYDGTIETQYEDSIFRAVVTLSYNAMPIG